MSGRLVAGREELVDSSCLDDLREAGRRFRPDRSEARSSSGDIPPGRMAVAGIEHGDAAGSFCRPGRRRSEQAAKEDHE